MKIKELKFFGGLGNSFLTSVSLCFTRGSLTCLSVTIASKQLKVNKKEACRAEETAFRVLTFELCWRQEGSARRQAHLTLHRMTHLCGGTPIDSWVNYSQLNVFAVTWLCYHEKLKWGKHSFSITLSVGLTSHPSGFVCDGCMCGWLLVVHLRTSTCVCECARTCTNRISL